MSLCLFAVAPGEVFTKSDIGATVYAVAVLERWVENADGSASLRRDLMIGWTPPRGPLAIFEGFPFKVPFGTIESIDPHGVWVSDHEAG